MLVFLINLVTETKEKIKYSLCFCFFFSFLKYTFFCKIENITKLNEMILGKFVAFSKTLVEQRGFTKMCFKFNCFNIFKFDLFF